MFSMNKRTPLAQLKSAAAVATLTIFLASCSSNDDESTTQINDDPVATPIGLTSTVLSTSSAQIDWDVITTEELTYEITRDGAVVITTSETSFIDSAISSSTSYTYGVVAITADNRRSEQVQLTLVTLDDPATSLTLDDLVFSVTPKTIVPPTANDQNISEPANLYEDGYSPANVIRVDLRTVIEEGPCDADDETGCTLADVIADVDKTDDHTVDINVHFSSSDFADDGSVSNASLRLRGGGSRAAPQKSFRIKLDSKEDLWRGERHLQLNKHPFDSSRIRNKLAMDIMAQIPNLPSMRTQFVNLWIDDGQGPVDYGLFTHVERPNGNFLKKRGWSDNDNLYKAEYFKFTNFDRITLRVDEDGEPINKDLFESTLEIENGDDHRKLYEMLTALHDPARAFDSVFNQYFDRGNVIAWVTANTLLRQRDIVGHNFILYNPLGTEKFYFIPWDYDEAMGNWTEPPNDLSADSLRQRSEYGYGLVSQNTFLNQLYRQPGFHEEVLATIDNIRLNHVSQDWLEVNVSRFIAMSEVFQGRAPDRQNNQSFNTFASDIFIDLLNDNEQTIRDDFGLLMPPTLAQPTLESGQWRMSWEPAHDATSSAGTIQYRLQIATTPTLDADSIVVDIDNIQHTADEVVQFVPATLLPAGDLFARLIATPSNQPERYWQISGNKLWFDNATHFGVMHFIAP